MIRRALVATVLSGAVFLALPAAAAAQTESQPAAAAQAGPTLSSASIGARAVTSSGSELPEPSLQAGGGLGQAGLLMILGGATFLAGAIIGDDAGTIVMLAGAGIGLYGLYLYLQRN